MKSVIAMMMAFFFVQFSMLFVAWIGGVEPFTGRAGVCASISMVIGGWLSWVAYEVSEAKINKLEGTK